MSKAHRVSFYLSPFQETKRGKVNPLRSSHLTSGAAESLLFMAHPEGLSTNGIHMISISSERQEPAFQRISFLLQRTQSRHRATAGKRMEEKKQHIFNNRPVWPDLEMEIQWPHRAPDRRWGLCWTQDVSWQKATPTNMKLCLNSRVCCNKA